MDRTKSTAKAPQSRRNTPAARTERTKPSPLTHPSIDRIHFLQRTVGNHATGTLLAGHTPAVPLRIQRQARKKKGQPRLDRIKEHVKTRFPELHALVADNPLNGTFAAARTETIEGKAHTWEIAVIFQDLGLLSRGRTGPAESPKDRPNVHRINVLINTSSLDAMLEEDSPNDIEREEFRRAETLAHELIHALVLMQQQGALTTEDGKVLAGYRKISEIARSSATRKEREQVSTKIALVLLYLELLENDDDARDRFIEKEVDELVEEKYANQTARTGFAGSIDNKTIAALYVDGFVRGQEAKSKATGSRQLVNLTRVELRDAAKNYFDKIDSELAASAQPKQPTKPRRRVFGPEP